MKCKICGKEFEKNSHCQIYCSANCRNKGKLEKMKEARQREAKTRIKEKPIAFCRSCHKAFTPNSKYKAYCSDECRKTGKKPYRKNTVSVGEINAKARAAGMSYGKYVEAVEKGAI